jgi:hypothetical protein
MNGIPHLTIGKGRVPNAFVGRFCNQTMSSEVGTYWELTMRTCGMFRASARDTC